MKSNDILIVDDEIGIRDLLSEILQDEGYTVSVAENAKVAREFRNKVRPALVLLDIWMPDCDGLSLLKEWSKNGLLDMPVIMMSGHASIDTAIEATRVGALDFLEKPIALNKLLDSVKKGLKQGEIMLSSAVTASKLGNSDVIKGLNEKLQNINKKTGNILLIGEQGSPFDMIANYFHNDHDTWIEFTLEYLSNPKNISNLENNHQKGVLYFGDISYFSKENQRCILSILKKNEDFKLRIISSSSISLENLYSNVSFDTAFVNEISHNVIYIPPIRDHISDIFTIINNILIELVESKQVKMIRFSSNAINIFSQYNWPGNYEQLRSIIRSLALKTEGGVVDDALVVDILNQYKINSDINNKCGINFDLPLRKLREEVEKRYFEYHMKQENFNMSKVARTVGLERTHLYRKLRQLGIDYSSRKSM